MSRVDTVFSVTHGPVHAMLPEVYGQAWCGVKAQYRHRVRPGTAEDVDCSRCLKALSRSQPQSWKSK